MKRILFFLLLFSLPILALSTPAPPEIPVSVQGLDLSVSWNPVAGADGCRLSYAIAQGAPQLFYNLVDSIIMISWQPVPNATGYILQV